MQLYAQIKNGKIIPEYNSDYDKLAKLRNNETYRIEIKQPRNIAFHRKFFALVNMVYENQDLFNNPDELRYFLIMKAGYYKRVSTPTGEMFLPLSISFAKMDETEFSELYSRVLDVVCKFLDITKEDIQLEIVNYM